MLRIKCRPWQKKMKIFGFIRPLILSITSHTMANLDPESHHDDDLSKINLDGMDEKMIMEMLTETSKIWVDVEPKYKQCEKNFKIIKKWMIENDKNVLVTEFGAVALKKQSMRRVIMTDMPELLKETYRKTVHCWMLRKCFG